MYASVVRRFPSSTLNGDDVLVPLIFSSPESRSLPGHGSVTARLCGRRLRVDASVDLPAGVASALSIVWQRWADGALRGPETDAQFALASLRWLESHGGEVLEAIAAMQAEVASSSEVSTARAASSSGSNNSSVSLPPATATAAAVSSSTESAGNAPSVGTCGGASGGSTSGEASGNSNSGANVVGSSSKSVRLSSRPPSPPRTPLDAALVYIGDWTRDEHAAFERVLSRLFSAPAGRRLDDARAWVEISAAVGTPRATPAACAARFLALSHVARSWLQRSRDTVSTTTSSMPPPDSAATQARTVKVPTEQRANRGISEDTLRVLEAADVPAFSHSMRGNGARGGASTSGAGGGFSGDDNAASPRVDQDSGSDISEGGEEGDDDDGDDDGDEHGVQSAMLSLPQFFNVSVRPGEGVAAGAAFALNFERLSIHGIGSIAGSRVALSLTCRRCETQFSCVLSGASVRAGGDAVESGDRPLAPPDHRAWCSKCSALLSVGFRASLVHEGSPVLGIVEAPAAKLFLVSWAALALACLECGALAEVDKFNPPTIWEAACKTCYARMRLDARAMAVLDWPDAAVSLAARSAPITGGGGGSVAARPPPGRPLPDTGTCLHFKNSHRWLRFPCCANAFPCDVCHDARADHPHEYAKRMICGFCAREQPYTARAPCVACGAVLSRRTGGATGTGSHWEGGSGQRQRVLLDARDRRKTAGGPGKTQSAKATRVGSARERAAAEEERGGVARTFQRYHGASIETVTVRGGTLAGKRSVTRE